MILADTSVWVDHLRGGDDELAALLENRRVATHPFVIGELACGHLERRAQFLAMLQKLPMLPLATNAEVLFFIERQQLMGKGIGYVDTHLLTAAALAAGARLWTRDTRLQAVAGSLSLDYQVSCA